VVKSSQTKISVGDRAKQGGKATRAVTEKQPIVFDGKKHRTVIYEREQLVRGKKYAGPAVITEYSATTIVPPRMQFWVDRADNLVIRVG
jgi:N-methylhydantoinase A